MKTPEQMAEDILHGVGKVAFELWGDDEQAKKFAEAIRGTWLAGYQAAKDETNLLTSAKWISVKERLPEPNVAVLASIVETVGDRKINDMEVVTYRSGVWLSVSTYYPEEAVSHWMPLPEAPKGEG